MSSYLPKYVRNNGTFCVIVKFETPHNSVDLTEQVAEWSKKWIEENKHWHRVWVTGDPPTVSEEQDLDYFEIFTDAPYIMKADNNQLWLCFEGMYSYWWRDWLARIVVGLIRAFPELHNYKLLVNCDQFAHTP